MAARRIHGWWVIAGSGGGGRPRWKREERGASVGTSTRRAPPNVPPADRGTAFEGVQTRGPTTLLEGRRRATRRQSSRSACHAAKPQPAPGRQLWGGTQSAAASPVTAPPPPQARIAAPTKWRAGGSRRPAAGQRRVGGRAGGKGKQAGRSVGRGEGAAKGGNAWKPWPLGTRSESVGACHACWRCRRAIAVGRAGGGGGGGPHPPWAPRDGGGQSGGGGPVVCWGSDWVTSLSFTVSPPPDPATASREQAALTITSGFAIGPRARQQPRGRHPDGQSDRNSGEGGGGPSEEWQWERLAERTSRSYKGRTGNSGSHPLLQDGTLTGGCTRSGPSCEALPLAVARTDWSSVRCLASHYLWPMRSLWCRLVVC